MVKKLLSIGIPLWALTLLVAYFWKYDVLSALFGQGVVLLYIMVDTFYDYIADRKKYKKEQ